MIPHEYPVFIREFHLDTFGHVNNATYLSLFEEARWEIITQNGFGLKEVQERQIGPVVLEIQIKFLKELKLREQAKILTTIEEGFSKIGKMKQTLLNQKGEISSEAIFTFGLMDLKQRKLIAPTPEWLKAIGLS